MLKPDMVCERASKLSPQKIPSMDISLDGKQILITGGTSALGAAFVTKAVQSGGRVFFTYCSNSVKAKELELLGAKSFRVDLADTAQIRDLKNKLLRETDSLDGLIHNAALVRDRTIEKLEEADWDCVISADLKSVYVLTRELLSFLFKVERSKVLTVVSQVGLHGAFGQANYAAAKGGLIAMTKTLARELGRKKILVNGLNPGFMISGMTQHLPERILEENKNRSVLRDFSDPAEVANFMVYLMSDCVQRASGQIFHYDSRIV